METFILKKNTILYRSSVDICKMFNKNLNYSIKVYHITNFLL